MASPSLRLVFAGYLPPLISGTDKATHFIFDWYIYRANLNESPLKILKKKERGHIEGLPNFLGTPYYPRNG